MASNPGGEHSSMLTAEPPEDSSDSESEVDKLKLEEDIKAAGSFLAAQRPQPAVPAQPPEYTSISAYEAHKKMLLGTLKAHSFVGSSQKRESRAHSSTLVAESPEGTTASESEVDKLKFPKDLSLAGSSHKDERRTVTSAGQPDVMECEICMESRTDLRVLPCGHTFCCQCLEILIRDNMIRCPSCRADAPLGTEGVCALLPQNSTLIQLIAALSEQRVAETTRCAICHAVLSGGGEDEWACVDCKDNLCAKCASAHGETAIFLQHEVVSLATNNNMKCSLHLSKKYRHICVDCRIAVCGICVVTGHRKHKVVDANIVVNGGECFPIWDRRNKDGHVPVCESKYRDALVKAAHIFVDEFLFDQDVWKNLHHLHIDDSYFYADLMRNTSIDSRVELIHSIIIDQVWQFHGLMRAFALAGYKYAIPRLGLDPKVYETGEEMSPKPSYLCEDVPECDENESIDSLLPPALLTLSGYQTWPESVDDCKVLESIYEERKEAESIDEESKETDSIDEERKEAESIDEERKEAESVDEESKEAESIDEERKEPESIVEERKEAESIDDESKEAELIDESMDWLRKYETAEEIQKHLRNWIKRHRLACGIEVADQKLAIYIEKNELEECTASLEKELESIVKYFPNLESSICDKDSQRYKIVELSRPLKIIAHSFGAGSKTSFIVDGIEYTASLGGMFINEFDPEPRPKYIMTTTHAKNLLGKTFSFTGRNGSEVLGVCVAYVYHDNPVVEACLIKVEYAAYKQFSPFLIDRQQVTETVPSGPFNGTLKFLDRMRTNVRLWGAESGLKDGVIHSTSYEMYDTENPDRYMEGLILTGPSTMGEVQIGVEGDSGAWITRTDLDMRQVEDWYPPGRVQPCQWEHVMAREAISVHSHGVTGVLPGVGLSASFRLHAAITELEKQLRKPTHLIMVPRLSANLTPSHYPMKAHLGLKQKASGENHTICQIHQSLKTA